MVVTTLNPSVTTTANVPSSCPKGGAPGAVDGAKAMPQTVVEVTTLKPSVTATANVPSIYPQGGVWMLPR